MIYQHPDRQIPLTVILLKSDIMRGTMYLFLLLISTMCIFGAHADDNSITTSKDYVDSQVATLQDEIPAINSNTVLTHTGTSGEIGTKQIYDENADYASQQNSLVSAGTFNTAIQNAIDNEFVCIDWLGEHVPNNCLLWKIRPAYHPSKNLFDKNSSDIRWCWINYDESYIGKNIRNTNCVGSTGEFGTSALMAVTPNTTYTASNHMLQDKGYLPSFIFLDENLIIQDGFHNHTKTTITFSVPNNPNIKYMVMPIHRDVIDMTQLEEGSVATEYVPYGNIYMPTSN